MVSSSSFIFVYKRLTYATNGRNMLRSNKEKCGYLTVKKSLMTCLAVSIEYRRVTDRQTDG